MSSPTSSSQDLSQILVVYNWTVPSESIKSCLYDDDIFYEYDDYQDDVKIESPAFGPERDPDKFIMKLYPRSTEGCSDVGSLVLQLKHDDELRVEKFKVSINGYSNSQEKYIDGICRKSTALLTQSCLGWRNTFPWKDIIRNSTNLNIYCEITYHDSRILHMPPTAIRTFHQQRLSEDFGSLLSRSSHSDIILCTVDGQEFPVHKAILSARSPVFDAMFSHEQCEENQKKRVDISDISGEVMRPLLAYIYKGDTNSVGEYAAELLTAADKYDIQPLIKVCVQSMLDSIDVESAAKLFYTADMHRLDELKNEVMAFINRNPRKVMATEGWKLLVKPRADLIEELYGNLADRTVSGLCRFR